MEIAEAYVTIRAETAELKKGLEGAKAETQKAASYMDKQARSMTAAFMRMGGGISLIQISTSALAGAFEQIKAEKAFDTARQVGNLNAMIAAYQRANVASRRWMESIPFLGGALSQLAQALDDDSMVQFAQELDIAANKAEKLTGALDDVLRAEIILAKVQGRPPAEIATLETQLSRRERARLSEERAEATREARERMVRAVPEARAARQLYLEAHPPDRWGVPLKPTDIFGPRPRVPRKLEVKALEETAEKATTDWIKLEQARRRERVTEPILRAAEKATVEKAGQVKMGMVLGGAVPNVPAGGMLAEPSDAIPLLERIDGTLQRIESKLPLL